MAENCQKMTKSGKKKQSFFIFSAIWRPNELKFGVKIGFQKILWVPKRKKKFWWFLAELREKNKIWKRQNLAVFFLMGPEAPKKWLYTPVMGTHVTTMASGSRGYQKPGIE